MKPEIQDQSASGDKTNEKPFPPKVLTEEGKVENIEDPNEANEEGIPQEPQRKAPLQNKNNYKDLNTESDVDDENLFMM